MKLFHRPDGSLDMSRKKENDYDLKSLAENPEYTEGDRIAVEFMRETADQFDPEPEYITQYYVLWKTAGTNLPRWDGPYDDGDTALAKMGTLPNAFMLSTVVEKETDDSE
jgi:hypothetical protein